MSRADQFPLRQPVTDAEESVDRVSYAFSVNRREFVQGLGAGLMISVLAPFQSSVAQERGRNRSMATVANRLHIASDGRITVFTGKVECGQGARAELTQAAAEELRVAPEQIRMIMADTDQVPDDGGTAGSRTTPSTVPAVRTGCAVARQVLIDYAATQWGVQADRIRVLNGMATEMDGDRQLGYQALASSSEMPELLRRIIPDNVVLSSVSDWKTLGRSLSRPNGPDVVMGKHLYPSDLTRPGMLYGAILRAPSYNARLKQVDLAVLNPFPGVHCVRDGDFIGVAAPTSHLARQAIDRLRESGEWIQGEHPSSRDLENYFRNQAGDVSDLPDESVLAKAQWRLKRSFQAAYIQHAPMEPRAAVAEWEGDKLTVWTGTQMPFRVKSELASAFRISEDKVRVIVPDFGGGFGGKHSGECAVEAARIAKEVQRPVHLRWTREEEFTWAYFRPAALIDVEAWMDGAGTLSAWHFVNMNSGGNGLESPYRCGKQKNRFVRTNAPLRHGSYRSLAVTANNFAREVFMDELAGEARTDPLEFRLKHLEPGRLRDVLVESATRFDWNAKSRLKLNGWGVGMACGIDKGSYVAACVEVMVINQSIVVKKVCQAFECGKILNPDNLDAQVKGAIIMGLGPVLSEGMVFENGRMKNAAFSLYRVPRFKDVPELEIHLLDRPDLDSVGAGETPLIAVAPAIANAVFHATGRRVRTLPIRLDHA